jgi:hypothetical protein
MQNIPVFAGVAVFVEFLVTCNAPHVGSNLIFLFQNFRRLDDFQHDRARTKQLRLQLGAFCFRAVETVQVSRGT